MIDAKKLLLTLSVKYDGDFKNMLNAIKAKEKISDAVCNKAVAKVKCEYMTLLDEDHPQYLKTCYQPPFILYYKGNKTLLDEKKYKRLAIIGSREPSDYAIKAISTIINSMFKKHVTTKLPVIVVKINKGVSRTVVETALKHHAKIIGVLTCGIDKVYPKECTDIIKDILDNNGLIISEYPNMVSFGIETGMMSNRIVAALANKVLIIEAKQGSGCISTLMHKLVTGGKIMAVPSNIGTNSVCNSIIQDGALCVTSGDDVLNIMNDED